MTQTIVALLRQQLPTTDEYDSRRLLDLLARERKFIDGELAAIRAERSADGRASRLRALHEGARASLAELHRRAEALATAAAEDVVSDVDDVSMHARTRLAAARVVADELQRHVVGLDLFAQPVELVVGEPTARQTLTHAFGGGPQPVSADQQATAPLDPATATGKQLLTAAYGRQRPAGEV